MDKKVLEIQNCFEFKCPKLWDDLEKTNNKDVKFCFSCEKNVYKATSFDLLFKLAHDGKCISFFDELYGHKVTSNQTIEFIIR